MLPGLFDQSNPPKAVSLQRRLNVYKIAVGILTALIIILSLALYRTSGSNDVHIWQEHSRPVRPPHYHQVMKVLNGLEYSRIPVLARPDVKLSVDFKNKRWSLTNLYRYDSQGDIVLENKRYGICSELTAYVLKQIKPFFPEDEYVIKFAQVNETRFYMKPDSVHIVLLIIKKSSEREVFILDPSFKEYGSRDTMGHYYIRQTFDNLPLLVNKGRDQEIVVGGGRVILAANQDSLVSFRIEPVFNKLDRNNFALALTATRRHWYVGRYIYALIMTPTGHEVIENPLLAKRVLTRKDFEFLKKKMLEWFEEIKAVDTPDS